MEINWLIKYDGFCDKLSLVEAREEIFRVYTSLSTDGQPKKIEIDTAGIGHALYDYLKSKELPVVITVRR